MKQAVQYARVPVSSPLIILSVGSDVYDKGETRNHAKPSMGKIDT